MLAHLHYLGDDGLVGPVYTKNLGELLQVMCGSLANGEDGITQPIHAKAAELLVEEVDAKLAG